MMSNTSLHAHYMGTTWAVLVNYMATLSWLHGHYMPSLNIIITNEWSCNEHEVVANCALNSCQHALSFVMNGNAMYASCMGLVWLLCIDSMYIALYPRKRSCKHSKASLTWYHAVVSCMCSNGVCSGCVITFRNGTSTITINYHWDHTLLTLYLVLGH